MLYFKGNCSEIGISHRVFTGCKELTHIDYEGSGRSLSFSLIGKSDKNDLIPMREIPWRKSVQYKAQERSGDIYELCIEYSTDGRVIGPWALLLGYKKIA